MNKILTDIKMFVKLGQVSELYNLIKTENQLMIF